MEIIKLEVDPHVYNLLIEAAHINRTTLEQECLRRLASGGRQSYYMQALLAEMRAEDQQRRALKSKG
ncbi:hypothetical protein ABQX22_01085 [Xanthomonas sp. WHRI 1810A]|uniref:hypothetical protein n=1 Tax=Xanthomonas sp. WHRI 1810A TaxID=3161565 RepID=UPI0032E88113